jgi:hypothetical protein
VVGRAQGRFQVQLISNGKKILLRPGNLELVDQVDVSSKERAALQARAQGISTNIALTSCQSGVLFLLSTILTKSCVNTAPFQAWALVNKLHANGTTPLGGAATVSPRLVPLYPRRFPVRPLLAMRLELRPVGLARGRGRARAGG